MVITRTIKNLQTDDCCEEYLPIELFGTHGIGKTAMIKAIGKELNMDTIIVNISHIVDPSDLAGRGEFIYILEDGTHVSKDLFILNYPNPETSPKVKQIITAFMETGWFPQEHPVGTILFLDDANNFVQGTGLANMIKDLIWNRSFRGKQFPHNTHIILTGNPANDEYDNSDEDAAQISRKMRLFVEQPYQHWIEDYAIPKNVNVSLVAFIASIPMQYKASNPRSITMFNTLLKGIDFSKMTPDDLNYLQIGGTGIFNSLQKDSEFVSSFISFVQSKFHLLISPSDVFELSDEAMARKLKAIQKEEKDVQSGIYYAMSQNVKVAVEQTFEKGEIPNVKRVVQILKSIELEDSREFLLRLLSNSKVSLKGVQGSNMIEYLLRDPDGLPLVKASYSLGNVELT